MTSLLVSRLEDMDQSIFYSWQSDSPSNINRDFIKKCVQEAIRQLNQHQTLYEALRLDQDTHNVSGMPDIATTIFTKISESALFIPDLTLSFKSKETGKNSPNPNVLIEFGYAWSAIGDSQIIAVMNTAFGKAESLPFDLAHKRWPLQYELNRNDGGNSKKLEIQKKLLTQKLSNEISLAMRNIRTDKIKNIGSAAYIKNCILCSDSKKDWNLSESSSEIAAVYLPDTKLRLVIPTKEDELQQKDFKEPWANCHPDSRATGYYCHICYSSSKVWYQILVDVDGGRAMLPMPPLSETGGCIPIPKLAYKIAKIMDLTGRLDEYMQRSKLSVEQN